MQKKLLENTPNLKLRSRTHHWKEKNTNEIKLLSVFLLQRLHQKPNNKSYFSQRKILETPTYLDLFSERFHLLLKFHHVDNKKCQHCETRYNCENSRVALCASPFPMLPCGGQLLEMWKRTEVQQAAKKYMTVRFYWLRSVLWAGIENYTIIIHSMCHWSCNNVSSGIIVLVMIS
jgi:hypothetical protein